MDEHSAKTIEIERMTGLKVIVSHAYYYKLYFKFFQSNTIDPAVSVAMRTFMSEFGDFEKLLPLDDTETTTPKATVTPPSPPTESSVIATLVSVVALVGTIIL